MVKISIGIKRRASEKREYTRGGAHFQVSHQGQVNQAFDRSFFQVSPEYLVLGLDFFASRVSRHLNAKQAQAFESHINTLRLFRFYDVQMNLEAVGRCLVDCRRTSSYQLINQPLGFIEISAQEFTLSTLKKQGE